MYDQPIVQRLDRADCLRLLGGAQFGRIVYTVKALPAVQPVNFVVRDDSVIIRTQSESKLATAVSNRVVAFQVDDIDSETQSGWSVSVVGHCYEVETSAEVEELRRSGPQAWGNPRGERFIGIRIEQITGRWLHSPALPSR
ncbi:MAG: pyridoxamine 5'-phosphate oxidase family protein [Mycobacteriales bacterium]